uniref:C2H2-type domain-containing protein n=1 Tax=Tetranychus urticae TaxID=32264 RepID=T1K0B8_TETUR
MPKKKTTHQNALGMRAQTIESRSTDTSSTEDAATDSANTVISSTIEQTAGPSGLWRENRHKDDVGSDPHSFQSANETDRYDGSTEEEDEHEPTGQMKQALVPLGCWYAGSVVGKGYLGEKKYSNLRYRVVWDECLVHPDNITGSTDPVPEGLGTDWQNLIDCENPEHIIKSCDDSWRCRWCANCFTSKGNQYRHERQCTEPGAPGHLCNGCKPNCPGPGTFTYDVDRRIGNKSGKMGGKRQKKL